MLRRRQPNICGPLTFGAQKRLLIDHLTMKTIIVGTLFALQNNLEPVC